MLKPGYGLWLMVIASVSIIVIGITGFVLQVSQTLASPEMRSAMAEKVKREHQRRAEGAQRLDHANLPSLQHLTDSPGVKLAYRLAIQKGENSHLILATMFTTAWNTAVAVLLVVTLGQILSGGPSWFLSVLLVFFLAVAFYATRWFFSLFRKRVGIGPTAVEIDSLPLLPEGEYRLYVCQYGRVEFQKLDIYLAAFEETTYQQGTDVRTETRQGKRIDAVVRPAQPSQAGEPSGARLQLDDSNAAQPEPDAAPFALVAEPEKPLELDCTISLPADMMHSFQAEHSVLAWKIVVEGESPKWPAFCRKFPVAVYPRSAV